MIDVVDLLVVIVVVGCCVLLIVVEDWGSWGVRVVVECCCVEFGDVGDIGCCVLFVKGVDCCGLIDVEVVLGWGCSVVVIIDVLMLEEVDCCFCVVVVVVVGCCVVLIVVGLFIFEVVDVFWVLDVVVDDVGSWVVRVVVDCCVLLVVKVVGRWV